jgi:hypothetical protein
MQNAQAGLRPLGLVLNLEPDEPASQPASRKYPTGRRLLRQIYHLSTETIKLLGSRVISLGKRRSLAYRSSFVFLQTISVWPVLESILVVMGTQAQDTVLAFSCRVMTQCSMISALEGGIWLRTGRATAGAGGGAAGGGGGATVTGCLAAQPLKSELAANNKHRQLTFRIALKLDIIGKRRGGRE